MSLNRDTRFTYLGHATVLVETPGGKRILIDPWLTDNPACPDEWKDPARLGAVDLILLTHLHNDHTGDAQAVIAAYPEAELDGMYEACNWLAGKGARRVRPMNKGGRQNVAGIEIV